MKTGPTSNKVTVKKAQQQKIRNDNQYARDKEAAKKLGIGVVSSCVSLLTVVDALILL